MALVDFTQAIPTALSVKSLVDEDATGTEPALQGHAVSPDTAPRDIARSL